MKNIINDLSRFKKSIIIIIADVILGFISLIAAIIIQDKFVNILDISRFFSLGIASVLSVSLSAKLLSIDKIVIRGFSLSQISSLFFYSLISSFFIYVFSFLLITYSFQADVFLDALEISIKLGLSSAILIFVIIFFIFTLFLRIFLINLVSIISSEKKKNQRQITIFGAGNAGIQLMRSFDKDLSVSFLCFVDDNPNLRNTVISGIRVYSRKDFENFSLQNKSDEIWVAIPTLSEEQLKEIIKYLSKFSRKILSLPEINNLRFNSNFKNRLSHASISNFLGRETVEIEENIYLDSYKDKNILVTGAGGSIGSELCLQLFKSKPKLIVLFELNELALYNIEKKIETLKDLNSVKVICCLGSINDKIRINDILNKYDINIILHAAAYKHVHLVESNIIEGFKNNVIGTYNLIKCALEYKVDRFVLVSSDKAVRPTNIMGATKRMAEIIIQCVSREESKINLSIVRFGNVIGSSGSVIPLFMRQINSGGPVTVTDPEMTRYFMAIPEAAKLILTAGSFGNDGEIYLLDMGDPIKILDLAKNMIYLSGNKLKTREDEDEGIEIKLINKKQGEKIKEELLIDGKIKPTNHVKVMVLDETRDIDFPLEEVIINIEKAISVQDENIIKSLLNKHLKDYKPTR